MEMLIASISNAFHATTQAQKVKDIYDFINNAIAYGGEGSKGNDGSFEKNSSLYSTPNGEPTHTPEEWAKHYNGKTWNEIAMEAGQDIFFEGTIFEIRFNKGPEVNWRYVELDDGKVLDMRHVLVVGMKTNFGFKYGEALGWFGEAGQLIFVRNSALKKQDYFSNSIGYGFLGYLQQNSSYYNTKYSTREYGNARETGLSNYFLSYINSFYQK